MRREQDDALMRTWLGRFVVVVAVLLPVYVVAFTKIGAVVLVLSATHGVHVGDLVACVPLVALLARSMFATRIR